MRPGEGELNTPITTVRVYMKAFATTLESNPLTRQGNFPVEGWKKVGSRKLPKTRCPQATSNHHNKREK